MTPEPDYFRLAKEITDQYITAIRIAYGRGLMDGIREGKKIVNKVFEEGKK
jgi:hypothetical protein